MAETKLKQQAVQPEFFNSSMARQAILNGNFDVHQRFNGSAKTIPVGVSTYELDRWHDYTAADGGTLPTLLRSRNLLTFGDIPNSFAFTRLNVNGAGTSLGVNSIHYFRQDIEFGTRYLCGAGKKLTLSFWAKSDITNKKLGLYGVQNYGTGGSPTSPEVINATNWTLTSNWTKYTYTFTTNTLSGKTFGTNYDDTFDIAFSFMWGSNFGYLVGSTGVAQTFVGSGNIDIAQVQVCAGEVALPFVPQTYAQESANCRRYCRVFGTGTVGDFIGACYWNTTASALVTVPFDVPMRKEPILESATNTWESHTGVAATFIGVNSTYSSIYACVLDFQGMTGGAAAGDSVAVRAKDTTAKIVISADI